MAAPLPAAGPAASDRAMSQYLSFHVGAEEYGLDILKVQEVKAYSAITPLPNSPAYVRGVTNLRGTIIPVVDLRRKFGLPPIEYTSANVIIVATVGEKTVGLAVDAVSDVLSIPSADIQPPPDFRETAADSPVRGLAKVGDKLILLLDADKVIRDAGPVAEANGTGAGA